MPLHPNAVAQNCAAGDTAAGIDGDNGNTLALPPQLGGERIDKGALPRPGRTGDPDHASVTGERLQVAQSFERRPVAILDATRCAGESAHVAIADFLRPLVHQLLRSCRAITIRWISLVPSPIVQSFTSR